VLCFPKLPERLRVIKNDIYATIAEDLQKMIGEGIVVVSTFDQATKRFCIRAIAGLRGCLETVEEIFGNNPLAMSFQLKDVMAENSLRSGQLIQVHGGLHALSFGAIDEHKCRQLESYLEVEQREVYALGISREGILFGSVIILMRKGSQLPEEYKGAIEVFGSLLALALQLKQREEELRRIRQELEEKVEHQTAELKKINEELEKEIAERRRSEAYYRAIFENVGIAVVILDKNLKIALANTEFEKLSGYPREKLVGQKSLLDLLAPEDARMLEENIYKDPSVGMKYEARLVRSDGSVRDVILTVALEEERTISLVSLLDITERKQIEESLRESEEKLRVITESTNDAIVAIDGEGRIYYWNPAAEKIFGFTKDEALGKELHSLIVPDYYCEAHKREFQKFRETGQGKMIGTVFEVAAVKKDGTTFPVEVSLSAIRVKDQWHAVAVIRDISERKAAEERIRYLSFHDSLTGLYNRAFFEEELKRLDVPRQLPLSVIIGDLNGLKLVNDAFGHHVGDELLRKAAEIIQNCCRKEDIVARWGGDEFIILLPQTSLEEVKKIAKRIAAAFQNAPAEPIKPSISLGYATKEKAEENICEVVKSAENWMYRRKLFEGKSQRHAIISSFEQTLWEVAQETKEHVECIKEISRKIAEAIGLSEKEIEELELLARLHDIGMITVPREILNKEGPLTPEEWKTVRRHVEAGYRIAQSSYELAPIAEAILHHHERWDGKGYPQGLKGEEIPLLSRILAIADAYEVMTAGRPYRKAVSREEAVEEIRRNAGTQFDPHLVEVFLEVVKI